MYRNIFMSVIMSLAVFVSADTSTVNSTTENGVLQNDYVKAGVNKTTGTFGSGNNTAPGLMFDSTGTGTFNDSYDYLTPGSPFDGFSVKIDGVNYYNNNAGNYASISATGALVDGDNSLTWNGAWTHSGSSWGLQNTYTLGTTSPYIDIRTRITVGSAASDVWFAKYIDPDARAAAGDSSATDNVLGYGIIPNTNVAFSEATVSRYALGLYSTDSNVDAGISSWTQEADGYTGSKYYLPEFDADGNYQWTSPGCETLAWGCPYVKATDENGDYILADYGTGDDTIGLSWHWTDVDVGDILEASYAYIFGPSAFAAADDALEGGAGGGDTTTTDTWGTLTDVGSATDAAESGGDTTPPADPVYTYDYDSATYTDSLTAGSVNIIGEGLIAYYDEATGLYTTRSASFGGVLDMTRDSDVGYTVDDGTSGVENVIETFSRTVSGTHSDVMSDYTMNYDSAVYSDSGTTVTPVDIALTVSDDYSTRTGSDSATSDLTRTSIVPTDFTYDRTTVTNYADDFADDSGYSDTTYSQTTTSVVYDTYNLTVIEDFLRTVSVGVLDVEDTDVARFVDWDNFVSWSDVGSVETALVSITPASDLLTRSGYSVNSGVISRTSVVPTTITYDRTVTTVISDVFGAGSGYEDLIRELIETSQVTGIYDLLYSETYNRTVEVFVNDVLNNKFVFEDLIVKESQGMDEGTIRFDVIDPISTRSDFVETTEILWTVAGQEVYKVTTPTEFTYDRTVDVVVTDDFADSSAYSDFSTTTTTNSVVSSIYDIITEERRGRVAGVKGLITADVDFGIVAMETNRHLGRYTTFGVFGIDRLDHSYGIYDGSTNLFKLGKTKVFENNWNVGVGLHLANNNFKGITSRMDSDTKQFGLTASYHTVDNWKIALNVQHAKTEIEKLNSPVMQIAKFDDGILLSNRISIPNMPNIATNPSSKNTSASYLITTPGKFVKGVAGMTFGKEEYKDTESVVIDGLYHLQDESVKNSYHYGTVGAEFNYGLAKLSVLSHSDNVDEVSFKLHKQDDNKSMYFKLNKLSTDFGDTNSVVVGIKYTF